MGFVMGAVFVAVLVWALIVYAGKKADQALEAELQAAFREVRVTLSLDEIEELRRQVRELEDLSNAQVRLGALSKSDAHRRLKAACIQTAYTHIEVKRMFEPKADEPSGSAGT